MDLSFLDNPLYVNLLIGGGAFLAGGLVLKLAGALGLGGSKKEEDPRNHRIRQLEADLRLAERHVKEQSDEVNQQAGYIEATTARVRQLEETVAKKEALVEDLKNEVRISCAKTVELRRELTDRAEETIRSRVHIDDMETELQITKAGSDAVLDELNRVNEERDELSDTVHNLKKLVESD